LSEFDLDHDELVRKYYELKKECESLKALFCLIQSMFNFLGLDIQYQRFPRAETKNKIISAIETAQKKTSLDRCLNAIGLSKQRFHNWLRRKKKCNLADQSSCPKLSPGKITNSEIEIVKKFVTDPNYSYYSLSSIWCHLRKEVGVVISNSSFFRIIRENNLSRSIRVNYFTKPTEGLRAFWPNEIWHFDISVLKFNGIKAYVQCVRDNFSRFVLAANVSQHYGGSSTVDLLKQAIERAKGFGYFNIPIVLSDKGSENVNSDVKKLEDENFIDHYLAQMDILFSNSMIESFFHQLKNRYLYFQNIKTMQSLVDHILFYIREHNEKIRFLALNGAIPIEAYRNPDRVTIDKSKEKALVAKAVKKTNCLSSITSMFCVLKE